jgi:uncharacterized OsmC-like protein/esterase/lipase
MDSIKIKFSNQQGEELSARLEMPLDQHPHTFAIFAHCFTCGKDLKAIQNISRAMAREGIAVLRMDFTGLGESQGEFSDTNFTTNIQDLVAGAEYLKKNYEAPAILVGHSLGGAAVLFAAEKISSIKAVATIAAPADPEHVEHLLEEDLSEIEDKGKATVDIGGRAFTIKKHFLDDLEDRQLLTKVKHLRRALLVMHSPQDMIVEVDNARKIYEAALHPKSFISLDGADHLLSKAQDSLYVGNMIAHWAMRYLNVEEKESLKSEKQVVARIGKDGYTTDIKAGRHVLLADEPKSVGGDDFGPTPYALLAAALGSCTVMTLRMYADRKQWPLEAVTVHLEHNKRHAEDCGKTDDPDCRLDRIERVLEIEGPLSDEQLNRLVEIADRCPVHKTLHSGVEVKTVLRKGE